MNLNHEPMSPVFDKWHVEGLPIAAVFHRFKAPDGGDPHDHPWSFRSVVLCGGYVEQVFDLKTGSSQRIERLPGSTFMVEASHVHRIVELIDGECWTMIMPQGPSVRKSGFYQFRADGIYRRPWDGDFKPLREADLG